MVWCNFSWIAQWKGKCFGGSVLGNWSWRLSGNSCCLGKISLYPNAVENQNGQCSQLKYVQKMLEYWYKCTERCFPALIACPPAKGGDEYQFAWPSTLASPLQITALCSLLSAFSLNPRQGFSSAVSSQMVNSLSANQLHTSLERTINPDTNETCRRKCFFAWFFLEETLSFTGKCTPFLSPSGKGESINEKVKCHKEKGQWVVSGYFLNNEYAWAEQREERLVSRLPSNTRIANTANSLPLSVGSQDECGFQRSKN